MRVKRGQVWSLMARRGGRLKIQVRSVKGPTVYAVRVRDGIPTGQELEFRRSTMEMGLRGARLEQGAPPPIKLDLPPVSKTEARSASSLLKVTAPRHIQTTTPDSEKVLHLFEQEGLTLTRIAERLGLSKSAVQARLNRARWAREDAQNLKAALGR